MENTENDMLICFKVFGIKFTVARRRKVEGETAIQVDANKNYFKKLFTRIKNWFKRLIGIDTQ